MGRTGELLRNGAAGVALGVAAALPGACQEAPIPPECAHIAILNPVEAGNPTVQIDPHSESQKNCVFGTLTDGSQVRIEGGTTGQVVGRGVKGIVELLVEFPGPDEGTTETEVVQVTAHNVDEIDSLIPVN